MEKIIEEVYQKKDRRYGVKNSKKEVLNYESLYKKGVNKAIKKYNNNVNIKIENSDLLVVNKNYLEYDIYKWLKTVKIRCKKSTYSNYQYTVYSRIIPKFGKIKKSNITSELINNYTVELLDEGLMPKTIKDILILLGQILKFSNISIKIAMPKIPKNEIQIFSKEEQAKLEKNLLENMDLINFGIFFCLYTGLRIGELCALKWENIDIKNKKIKIKKTINRIKDTDNKSKNKTTIIIDDPKSISSIREIPIPKFILPILKEFGKNVSENSFLITGNDKFIETRTYFNHYKKVLKNINLKSYNFHALRHTFATRCIENGCDPKTLSEILGHSSVKITLERYVHPNYENKVKMMNQLKPIYT